MSAYEIFCQDLMGDELARRDTSRRAYYQSLRTALIGEVQSGGRCELLNHFAGRLEQGAPGYMYLLDAAALWECYDIIFGSVRFPRDLGVGFPINLGDYRRLSWEEADRLNRANALPAAVLDAQLKARLQNLVAYAQGSRKERDTLPRPGADGRACLVTVPVAGAGRIPVSGEKAEKGRKETAGELKSLQDRLALQTQELARMTAERDALLAERDALQGDVIRLQNRPRVQSAEDGTLLELVLNSRIAEAAERARETDAALKDKVCELQSAQQTLQERQEQLQTTLTLLEEQAAAAQDMRANEQDAETAAAQAREAFEEAQRGIARAAGEMEEAQKQQAAADAELADLLERLQDQKRRLAASRDAIELTRRQLDRLS